MTDDKILRIDEVSAMVRLSRATIWRLAREGRFPAAVVLSDQARGWKHSAVQKWIASRENTRPTA